MTTPINISVFQEYTALILNLLYRSFPNPISLDVKEIGKEMVDSLEISEEEKTRILDKDSINAMRFLADRKSTRLNSSHVAISYAVFCLKKKNYIYCIHNLSICWNNN